MVGHARRGRSAVRRAQVPRPAGVHITVVDSDDEYVGTLGSWGEGPGQFAWPASIAIDREQRLFIGDEHLNRITVMSTDGELIDSWGDSGSGDGQLDGPCGLAFDSGNTLIAVDHRNNRVQRFTVDGSTWAGLVLWDQLPADSTSRGASA